MWNKLVRRICSAKCFGRNRLLVLCYALLISLIPTGISVLTMVPLKKEGWVFLPPSFASSSIPVLENILAYGIGSYVLPTILTHAISLGRFCSFGHRALARHIGLVLVATVLLAQLALTFYISYISLPSDWVSFVVNWTQPLIYLSFLFGSCLSETQLDSRVRHMILWAWTLSILFSLVVVLLPFDVRLTSAALGMSLLLAAVLESQKSLEKRHRTAKIKWRTGISSFGVILCALLFYCLSLAFWKQLTAHSILGQEIAEGNFIKQFPPRCWSKWVEAGVYGAAPAEYTFLCSASNHWRDPVDRIVDLSSDGAVVDRMPSVTNLLKALCRNSSGDIEKMKVEAFKETDEDRRLLKCFAGSSVDLNGITFGVEFVKGLSINSNSSKATEPANEVFFYLSVKDVGFLLCSIGERTFNKIRVYESDLFPNRERLPVSNIIAFRTIQSLFPNKQALANFMACALYLLKGYQNSVPLKQRERIVLESGLKAMRDPDFEAKIDIVYENAMDQKSLNLLRNEVVRIATKKGDEEGSFSDFKFWMSPFWGALVTMFLSLIGKLLPSRLKVWSKPVAKPRQDR